MSVGTMTSKGQITIPKDVRLALGLTTGVAVSFTQNAEGDYVIRAAHHSAASLAGAVKYSGLALTLGEMDEAIVKGVLDQ